MTLRKHVQHCRATVAVLVLLVALPVLCSGRPGDGNGRDQQRSSNSSSSHEEDNGWIVVLRDPPAASYHSSGAATAEAASASAAVQPAGARVSAATPAAAAYAQLIEAKSASVAARAGVQRSNVLYTYSWASSGFSVIGLSAGQLEALQLDPAVAFVAQNKLRKALTLSTPRFLGLAGNNPDGSGGLWSKQLGGVDAAGDGIVVGVLDSGIWPEHLAFSDRRNLGNTSSRTVYSPVRDSGYTGSCDAGENFSSQNCNLKLIGCQSFSKAWDAKRMAAGEVASCRDMNGHGTSTASIAAGNFGVPFQNLGTLSGVAPKARIAMYKVVWGPEGNGYDADIIAGIDKAVADGVDIINFSVGGPESSFPDSVGLAFLRAAKSGIFIAAAAGNQGEGEVVNCYPWLTTVASSTHNRVLKNESVAVVQLGSGSNPARVFEGSSWFNPGVGPAPLLLANRAAMPGVAAQDARRCFNGSLDPATVRDSIVVCDRGANGRLEKSAEVKRAGGIAMLLVNVDVDTDSVFLDPHAVPTVHLKYASRDAIRGYGTRSNATATIRGVTMDMNATAPQVSYFSSTGPDNGPLAGTILKPDLTAPGSSIIAATSPKAAATDSDVQGALFAILSGTSYATPHVVGLAALIRQKHPTWSPAAIKSALMTTAYRTTRTGEKGKPIGDNPFKFGAGHINPEAALSPGLVFDSAYEDWYRFVCATKTPDIKLPADIAIVCSAACNASSSSSSAASPRQVELPPECDPANLNLPSVSLPALAFDMPRIVTRTVTNVMQQRATFFASTLVSSASTNQMKLSVTPPSFTLDPGQRQAVQIVVQALDGAKNDTHMFGYVTWNGKPAGSSGPFMARTTIPVAARTMPLLAAPEEVSPSMGDINYSYSVTPGFSGTLALHHTGLFAAFVTRRSITIKQSLTVALEMPANVQLARFSLFQTDLVPQGRHDLELYIEKGEATLGRSTNTLSNEDILLDSPEPGPYVVRIEAYELKAPSVTFALHVWLLHEEAMPNMQLPAALNVTGSRQAQVELHFSGLNFSASEAGGPPRRYLGRVNYAWESQSLGSTLVSIFDD